MNVLIKICGIKTSEEACAVAGLDVNFLGVIFVSSSKRRVNVETAREIARIAHQNAAKCVGVFALSSEKHGAAACECKNFSSKTRDDEICSSKGGGEICEDKIYAGTSGDAKFYEAAEFYKNERDDLNVNLNANCAVSASVKDLNSEILDTEALDEEQILKICSICELDCAQIYGRISADFKARLNAAGIEAWQVLSIGAEMPPLEGLSCDRILFDAKGANLGGNGISFDWEILREVKFDFGMAGGIGEHNVREAIKFNPRVLDLNSKVEDENGIKSVEKITKILEILNFNSTLE